MGSFCSGGQAASKPGDDKAPAAKNEDTSKGTAQSVPAAAAAAPAPKKEIDANAYPPTGISPNVQKLPDLSKHSNFMAEFLVANPGVYDALKDKKTSGGITLADCMKTGVDNPGHPHIKTVGLVACDEECYETFRELFDPVTVARQNYDHTKALQPTNMDINQLSKTDID